MVISGLRRSDIVDGGGELAEYVVEHVEVVAQGKS